MARKVRGVAAVEGVQTGDGRLIAEGAVTWVDPPLPLAWLLVEQHGTGGDGAPQVGTIQTLTRVGQNIEFTGEIDDEQEHGAELVRRLENGTAALGNRVGLSIDPDDYAMEVVMEQTDEDDEGGILILASARRTDGGGLVLESSSIEGMTPSVLSTMRHALVASGAMTAAAGDPDPEDGVVVYEDSIDSAISRFTRLRIRGATCCAIAAFDGAYLELDGTSTEEPAADDVVEDEAVVAAATAPVAPPAAWFDMPEPEDGDDLLVEQHDMDGNPIGFAVPLYITDDGQVFGHLAPANRCHIGMADTCITAPLDYSQFHIGYVVTEDGRQVATGPLVVGCDHAATAGIDPATARDHYANVGLAWADVVVRPGRMGGWMTGALRPGVTVELVRALRGGGVSGDWRGRDRLSLIACQAVNTPGFTVQRIRALAASATFVDLGDPSERVAVSEQGFTIQTAPIMRESDHSDCGCGGLTASADPRLDLVLARLDHLSAQMHNLDVRTRPMRAAALDELRTRLQQQRATRA